MKKVLLIDDDPVVIAVYSELFRARGFLIDSATDGEAGLTKIFEMHPDAVLLDLAMPRVNGLEWLSAVRADARFRTTPIVIFTAGQISWQVQAAHNADASYVLTKQRTDPQKVVDSIAAALAAEVQAA